MPTVKTAELQALLTKLGLSHSNFQDALIADGVAPNTARFIATETRSSTVEVTDESAIALTRVLGMSEDDLEVAGVFPSESPIVIHPSIFLIVIAVWAVAGYVYWASQRSEPDRSRIASVAAEIERACDAATNLPAWFSCRDKVLNVARDEWLPEWVATAAQDQALWSFAGIIVSSLALAVTATGVYYVAQTLGATRRAARAADRAAMSALEANRGFQLANERDLRAYVGVVEMKAFIAAGAAPSIRCTYRNYGKTPANQLRAAISFALVEASEAPDYAMLPERGGARTLSPGGEGTTATHGREMLTSEVMQKLRQGSLELVAWGRIEYIDAFGQSRATTMRRRLKGVGGDGELSLPFDESGGNDAN